MSGRVIGNALATIPAVLAGVVVISILGTIVLLLTALVGVQQRYRRS